MTQMVKNLPAMGSITRFNPWVGKIPQRSERLPTPVFLHREFHGQRSLVGYSPWLCKESDTTEQLSLQLPCVNITFFKFKLLKFIYFDVLSCESDPKINVFFSCNAMKTNGFQNLPFYF